MSTEPPAPSLLPEHLAERATAIRARLHAQLPQASLLTNNMLPLNPSLLLPYSGRLTPAHLAILELDAVSLVQSLKQKRWTAVDVVGAYGISASIAHQSTHCLTWYDLDSALARAKELDEILDRTGELVGPLHGIVISIKRTSRTRVTRDIRTQSTGDCDFSIAH